MNGRWRPWAAVLVVVSALGVCGCFGGRTPVVAALQGDVAALKEMKRRGVSLDDQDPNHANWTPLMAAIYGQQTNAIAYLLEQHVDLKKRDRIGETALLLAVSIDDTNTAIAILSQLAPANGWEADRASLNSLVSLSPISNEWVLILERFMGSPLHLPSANGK